MVDFGFEFFDGFFVTGNEFGEFFDKPDERDVGFFAPWCDAFIAVEVGSEAFHEGVERFYFVDFVVGGEEHGFGVEVVGRILVFNGLE